MNSDTLKSLVSISPSVLLTSMVLSFVVMAGLQIFFYAEVFGSKMDRGFVYAIAISIAIILQGSRFAFGLAAVNESFYGQYLKMLFGLLFSLALTVVETYEVTEMAHVWDMGSFSQSVTIILYTILWIGFGLEVRLILNVAGKYVPPKKEVSDAKIAKKTPTTGNYENDYFHSEEKSANNTLRGLENVPISDIPQHSKKSFGQKYKESINGNKSSVIEKK